MRNVWGNVVEALESINRYLERRPRSTCIWILKGDLLDVHYDDYEGAIECYDHVIKIDPKSEEAWVKKGYALKEMRKYAEAAECFKTALKLFNEAIELGYPVEYQDCYQGYQSELSAEYDDCLNLRRE